MFRKVFLIPVFVIGAGLFMNGSSAQAQVSVRIGIGAPAYPPAVIYRPAPVYVTPYISTYPPPVYVAHHHHYRVMYRASCGDPWITYQVVHTFDYANRVAHDLRHRGYETFVSQN